MMTLRHLLSAGDFTRDQATSRSSTTPTGSGRRCWAARSRSLPTLRDAPSSRCSTRTRPGPGVVVRSGGQWMSADVINVSASGSVGVEGVASRHRADVAGPPARMP